MASRLTYTILAIGMVAVAPSRSTLAQGDSASDLKVHIGHLSAFDYAARTSAARTLRRASAADAVPVLVDAVQHHADEFVRSRALILLTAFNDRGTPALMRTLVADRNDRVREAVYRWFERHPDAGLAGSLMAALDTEQAEFVRPALIRALAALPPEDRVHRALLAEVNRGFDFFRSAVIEALGTYRAAYAVDSLIPIAAAGGPLQDDAVLALGRIGGSGAVSALASIVAPDDVAPSMQAAQCLLGSECSSRITWLTDRARNGARADAARAAVTALRVLGGHGNQEAIAAVLALSRSVPAQRRNEVAIALAGAALEQPDAVLTWLTRSGEGDRGTAIELLHDGFEQLEEDFAEEQFYAAARAAYWAAPDGSPGQTLAATLIDTLEF